MITESSGLPAEFSIGIPSADEVPSIIDIVLMGLHDAHINPEMGIDEIYFLANAIHERSLDSIAKWERRIVDTENSRDVYLRVARSRTGDAIGMIDAKINNGQSGAILSCYVREEFRGGGKQGVAQALTDGALSWIGKRPSDVLIATYNRRSQGFFHRNGFVIPAEHRMIGKVPAQLWLRPEVHDE